MTPVGSGCAGAPRPPPAWALRPEPIAVAVRNDGVLVVLLDEPRPSGNGMF